MLAGTQACQKSAMSIIVVNCSTYMFLEIFKVMILHGADCAPLHSAIQQAGKVGEGSMEGESGEI